MKELYSAKYALGLALNDISDDDRSNYVSSYDMDIEEDSSTVLDFMISTVMRAILLGKYSHDVASAMMENEYKSLGVESVYGKYSLYKGLFDILAKTQENVYSYYEIIDLYKEYISIADSSNSLDIRSAIYHSVLLNLVKRGAVLDDIEFTSKVTEYVESSEHTTKVSTLSKIVSSVLLYKSHKM